MQFLQILTVLGFIAAAQACTPGQFKCGNQGGAPGPDGSIQVCNSSGNWQKQAQCGGRTCCNTSSTGSVTCTC